jgi:hypothetical protein
MLMLGKGLLEWLRLRLCLNVRPDPGCDRADEA